MKKLFYILNIFISAGLFYIYYSTDVPAQQIPSPESGYIFRLAYKNTGFNNTISIPFDCHLSYLHSRTTFTVHVLSHFTVSAKLEPKKPPWYKPADLVPQSWSGLYGCLLYNGSSRILLKLSDYLLTHMPKSNKSGCNFLCFDIF